MSTNSQYGVIAALLTVALLQSAVSLEGPGVVLASSGNTAFVTPIGSLHREGAHRSAVIVEIYPIGSERGQIVRRDTQIDFDCGGNHVRTRGLGTYNAAGETRQEAGDSYTEADLPPGWPPLDALRTVACGDMDPAVVGVANLEAELPRLRSRLH